jgi:hypothetical protein
LPWPDWLIGLERQGLHDFEQRGQVESDLSRRGWPQSQGWSIDEAFYADLIEPAGLLTRMARVFDW